MSWLDDLLGKTIRVAGTAVVDRKFLNFVSGATVVDNPSTGATDVTISGGSGGGTAYAGSNPNAGGDAIAGTRGDFLYNTGVWNGFEGWRCITTGTPGVWAPSGRGGNITGTSISYQALSTDVEVDVTSTASVRTITLPDVTTIAKTFDLTIKDCSFSNTGNNTLVVGHAGELIDGQSSYVSSPSGPTTGIIADGNGNSATFVWNGTVWRVK